MTIYEFTDLITDRYKIAKDDDGKTAGLYLKDFGFYPPSKLEKVWYAIKRHHRTNFAPNYSNIVDCMEKAGLGESTEGNQSWYQRCKKCGAKYSMGACGCPRCNKYLDSDSSPRELIINEVDIVKCEVLPNDVIKLRQPCSICKVYRNSRLLPKGISCDSYQGEMRGQLPECDTCSCRLCCMDTGRREDYDVNVDDIKEDELNILKFNADAYKEVAQNQISLF